MECKGVEACGLVDQQCFSFVTITTIYNNICEKVLKLLCNFALTTSVVEILKNEDLRKTMYTRVIS